MGQIVVQAMRLKWNARVIVDGGTEDFVFLIVELLVEVWRVDCGIVRVREMAVAVMNGVRPSCCHFVRSECRCLCLGVTDRFGIHLRHGLVREGNDLRGMGVDRGRVRHVVHGHP